MTKKRSRRTIKKTMMAAMTLTNWLPRKHKWVGIVGREGRLAKMMKKRREIVILRFIENLKKWKKTASLNSDASLW